MMKFAFTVALGCVTLLQAVALPTQQETFVCTEEGRFEDVSDCSSYIECISDREGRMMYSKRSCHGKAFNPLTGTCTKTSQVKGCHTRQSRGYSHSPLSKFQNICKNPTVDYACGDCMTTVKCIEGIAFDDKCDLGMRCTKNTEIFNGAVCNFNYMKECTCLEPNTYYQDPFYNGTFFLCTGPDDIPLQYNCPHGMYFNEETKMCLNRDGSPSCKVKGTFAYPNDCGKYYECVNAVEGWVQNKGSCPRDLLFNENSGVCENPCDWPRKDFTCEVEGRFGNPLDCNKFIECIIDLSGKLLRMNRECPSGYQWKEADKVCASTSNAKCKVKTEGPIEQCQVQYKNICAEPGNTESDQIQDESNLSDSVSDLDTSVSGYTESDQIQDESNLSDSVSNLDTISSESFDIGQDLDPIVEEALGSQTNIEPHPTGQDVDAQLDTASDVGGQTPETPAATQHI